MWLVMRSLSRNLRRPKVFDIFAWMWSLAFVMASRKESGVQIACFYRTSECNCLFQLLKLTLQNFEHHYAFVPPGVFPQVLKITTPHASLLSQH